MYLHNIRNRSRDQIRDSQRKQYDAFLITSLDPSDGEFDKCLDWIAVVAFLVVGVATNDRRVANVSDGLCLFNAFTPLLAHDEPYAFAGKIE